jgi:hypothetical protein
MRAVRITVAVLLACSVPASCSDGSGVDLTMRLRDGIPPYPVWCDTWDQGGTPVGESATCRFESAELLWTDGGERQAIQPPGTYFLSILSEEFGAYECGGDTLKNVWRDQLHPITTPQSDPFQLVMDDGSMIELSHGGGFNVAGRALDACAEMWGSWRGTGGDFDNRTGTYTMVNDSIQTVLHLVEN